MTKETKEAIETLNKLSTLNDDCICCAKFNSRKYDEIDPECAYCHGTGKNELVIEVKLLAQQRVQELEKELAQFDRARSKDQKWS
jgi:cytochrome c553